MKLTENQRRHIGESLTIRWGTSRGVNSYGYTTCSLRNQRGQRVAYCNGGGYDMRGTVIGNWIAATFPKELCAIRPDKMPKHSHWQSDGTRVCDGACKEAAEKRFMENIISKNEDADKIERETLPRLDRDCFECPACKGPTCDSRDGKTVDDGHFLYGLRFYDPNYNVLNAKLEKCDGTFTKPEDEGKTLGELQKAGKIVDLDIIRGWYKQTAPHSSARHTVPTIDGACGISSVMEILNATGLTLEKVHDSSKLDIYVIREFKPNGKI